MSSTDGNLEAKEEDRLLPPPEAARFLGNSVDTLARWRINGDGPPYIKLGTSRTSHIRYRRSELEAFLRMLARRSTSDPGPGR